MSNNKALDLGTAGLVLASIDAVAITGISIALFSKINSLNVEPEKMVEIEKILEKLINEMNLLAKRQDYLAMHFAKLNDALVSKGILITNEQLQTQKNVQSTTPEIEDDKY